MSLPLQQNLSFFLSLSLSLSLPLPQCGHSKTLARNSAIGLIFNQDCYWRWLEVQEKSLYNFRIKINSIWMVYFADNFEVFLDKVGSLCAVVKMAPLPFYPSEFNYRVSKYGMIFTLNILKGLFKLKIIDRLINTQLTLASKFLVINS